MQDSPLRRICSGPVINECPAAPKGAASSQIAGVVHCKQRMCELSLACFLFCFVFAIFGEMLMMLSGSSSLCADLGKSREKLAENPVATGSPPIDFAHSASATQF